MEYIEEIKSKLVIDMVTSLCDSEIERSLKDTVLGHRLIPLTKKYRDEKKLKYSDISNRIEVYKLTY